MQPKVMSWKCKLPPTKALANCSYVEIPSCLCVHQTSIVALSRALGSLWDLKSKFKGAKPLLT